MKQAVVLAAGEGQRLRPFTVTRPKAMLSIADKPILQYIVEALAYNGIREIVLVVGYRKEQVYDYFGAGKKFGVNLTYVIQDRQVGTAHALRQAASSAADEFLVLPGDNLIDERTIAGILESGPDAILVKRVTSPQRYGVVDVVNDEVRGIVEKPGQAASNLVNTGIYAFTKNIFKYTESELDIPDALNNMILEGSQIKALETGDTWLDVVYPWDIIVLNEAVLKKAETSLGGTIERGVFMAGKVVIGENSVLRAGSTVYGPVVIGSGCEIGPHVSVLPATSIGDNVVIGSFSEIKNTVVGNDVSIGPGSIVSDSVIARGCIVKGRFTALSGQSEVHINGESSSTIMGGFIGEDCRIDAGVTVQAGTIIGNYCQVQTNKLLSGRLPDKSLVY